MATVKSLSEAFFNSLWYFLTQDAAVVAEVSTRTYILYPDSNLSDYVQPFVGINFYNTGDEFWAMPDRAGTRSRMMRYFFTIAVYCDTYATQRYLPELVKREIEKETTTENGLDKTGIQVYSGWTLGVPDSGTELVVADIYMDMAYPLGGNDEEDVTEKYRSMIDAVYEVEKDKSKIFIDSDT